MEHEETRRKKNVSELRQEYPGTRFLFFKYLAKNLS